MAGLPRRIYAALARAPLATAALLVAAGGLLIYVVPPLARQLLARPAPDPADPADPGRLAVPAFAVRNPAGARIGTLSIEYPRRMRLNESGAVLVRYEAAESWRRNFATRPDVRIEASLSAARLEIVPEPPRHLFRNERIARTGADSQSWEVVPTVEGDYQLALRLEVQPAGFSVGAIDVNGEVAAGTAGAGDQRLPVTVHTRYSVSQATVDLATNAIRLLGFLVTLAGFPFLLSLFRRRRAAPDEPPEAAAAEPAKPGRSRRRRRAQEPGRPRTE